MKKRVYLIAAVVSGALAVSGCTTNPYTGEREAGKSAIGAGLGSLVGAGIGALSSSKKDRGKGALIGAAAGAALGGGVGYYMDVQEAKLRDKMRGTGVSVTRSGDNIKRAKLFKIDMEFFQDKPEARIWKLFKIKQRH